MAFVVEILTSIEMDGDTDSMRVCEPAEYSWSPEAQTVFYDSETEDGRVHTCITVTPEYVDIERDSAEMPCLHLREGEKTERVIRTAYGDIPFVCTCERVLSRLDGHGGRVHLRYTLELGGGLSHNSVNIKISEI